MNTELSFEDLAELAAAIREHSAVATGLGEWACKCSPSEWRPSAHRSGHVAEAVAPTVAALVAEAVEAERERVLVGIEGLNPVAESVGALYRGVEGLRPSPLAALRERIEALLAPGSTWPMPVSGREMVAADDVRALLNEGGQS